MCRIISLLAFFLLAEVSLSAARPHAIRFGKWTSVKCFEGARACELKVRTLLVDGSIKEFVVGDPHEVTDRMFVVQRVMRLNDSLPEDQEKTPRWRWQPGGWLLVNRGTGRVSEVKLSRFDPNLSAVSWYRDYAAYCALSEDGRRAYALVAQIGRRKPVLRKELGDKSEQAALCSAPVWQREPARVTFEPAGAGKVTFAVRDYGGETE